MEKLPESVTLRGVIISRETLSERYGCVLSDTEWLVFKSALVKGWKEDEAELRRLVFKQIKSALTQMDYKLVLNGKDLMFQKKPPNN